MQVMISLLIDWGLASAFTTLLLVVTIFMAKDTEFLILLGKDLRVILFNWYLWIIYFVLVFLFLVFWSK